MNHHTDFTFKIWEKDEELTDVVNASDIKDAWDKVQKEYPHAEQIDLVDQQQAGPEFDRTEVL